MEAFTYAVSGPFRHVALDGLSALYHRPSGATHVVAEPVPQILDALGAEALTVKQLLARLGTAYDVRDADEGALSARLEELASLGLVIRR